MRGEVRWTRGDPALQGAVARALAAGAAVRVRETPRRAIWRVEADGRALCVKQFRVGTGRHRRREAAKAWIGRAPAEREWRALAALRAAGVPVPAALALGTRPDGDRLLVFEWIEGVPLAAALAAAASGAARAALLAALGTALRAAHAQGWLHGDLHAGNVLATPGGPVLLDWQHARRGRGSRARARDLARLEYALAPLVSAGRRLRLRAIVLGVAAPFDAAARTALRAAGRAVERRAAAHARARTRRSCRPGRVAAAFSAEGMRGLRIHALAPGDLAALLAAHRDALARDDARVVDRDRRCAVTALSQAGWRVVVKETPWRGLGHALADAARGSAGARAWRGGHGLAARGLGAARPLAWGEQRRLGLPVVSWVVLEDLRPACCALDALASHAVDPAALADALARLAIALHRCGADHGDLKATHVWIDPVAPDLAPRLIDLDGVRFRRRVPDVRRERALAQLNASLPDALPAALRRRAFARYARALPWPDGASPALARVVRQSLARRHRWTGADCALGGPTPSPPGATGSSSTSPGSCRRAPA